MILASFFIFLVSSFAVWMILRARHAGVRNRISKRIEIATESGASFAQDNLPIPFDASTLKKPFALLDNAIRLFQFHKTMARELRLANLKIKVTELITIIAVLSTVPAFIAHILLHRATLTLILVFSGMLMPYLAVKRRQAARRKAFSGQLLDAITLISNSLKSGYSFLQALGHVARDLPPPMSEEFSRVLMEIEYGKSFDEAVELLVARMKSDDLYLIMTAVSIQRQVGGNLAEILDKIGHTIRERINIHGQVKTLTAQGRLSGLILSLMPIALVLLLLVVNPKYILVLFTKPAGQIFLTIAVFNQIIGMLMIRKIVNVKV